MEITREQVRELGKICTEISNEYCVDDDVTGGYIEEPASNWLTKIYGILDEVENTEIDPTILHKAIETYGTEQQIKMIEEECLELALAIQKYFRANDSETIREQKLSNIIDEIADVKIILKYAELIFSKELIDERVKYKMKRLENNLRTLRTHDIGDILEIFGEDWCVIENRGDFGCVCSLTNRHNVRNIYWSNICFFKRRATQEELDFLSLKIEE